jgi:hypothetical protein
MALQTMLLGHMRAMRVFRDQTAITAASNLSRKFRVALDDGMISRQQMFALGSAK